MRVGLSGRADLRVAVLAAVLSCHAHMRTHPEAIVVMPPLGEILAAHLEPDAGLRRAADAAAAALAVAQAELGPGGAGESYVINL